MASYEDWERGTFERYRKLEEDLIERGKDMLAREAECEQKLLAAEQLFEYVTKARSDVSLGDSGADTSSSSAKINPREWQIFGGDMMPAQLLQGSKDDQVDRRASVQVSSAERGTQTALRPVDASVTRMGSPSASLSTEFTPADVEHWFASSYVVIYALLML